MFTLEQIHAAHSQVRSGADFPQYIRDIKALGVRYYETFVADGHTHYSSDEGHSLSSQPRYGTLEIADNPTPVQFEAALRAHQQGKTDYSTFSHEAARSGIEKWVVCMDAMTCTYYDKAGGEILAESIPQ